MPGMSIGNLITGLGMGLGQFAQQKRQQDELRMRQQLQALYMKRQQDEEAAAGIQTKALLGGALGGGQGIGQIGAGGGMGGGTGIPIQQAVPPPMAPPVAPPATGQGPLLSSTPPITRQNLMPNQGMSVTGPPGAGIGTGIPPAPSDEDTVDIIPGTRTFAPPAEQSDAATATSPAAGSDTGGGGPQADMTPVLQGPKGQQIDLASFMTRVSPTDLMQRIEKVAPEATPQQKMAALNGLYKIYQSDNKTEQLLLAKVLGFNVGMARIETTQRGQDLSHQDRQAGQAISQQRADQGAARVKQADQRIQIAQARLIQAKSQPAGTQRQSALRALLSDIDRMIQPGGLNQPPDAETLKGLQEQRAQVVAALREVAGMAPAAAPAAAPQ
jgi:hypothetical protein